MSLAALLGLLVALLTIVELATGLNPELFLFSLVAATSGYSFSLDLTGLLLYVALGATGFILTLLELRLYRRAFRTLAPYDPRFSTPADLALTALVALGITILVFGAMMAVISQASLCATFGNPVTSTCINWGEVAGLAVTLLIVSVVYLIGYIGLLVGVWRLGIRYGEESFRLGAVLLIIPVLNVVGALLVLVTAQSAGGKFEGAPPPPPAS